MKGRTHQGEDGLTYDDEGYFIYTGISPLSEDEDVIPDAPEE